MITPAVLILACGSLTLATSQRLGRVIERTRRISSQLKELARNRTDETLLEEERVLLLNQLSRATRRARLLQRAMICLYLALSIFVATSVAIGIVAVSGQKYTWVPIPLGLAGAGLLFYTSLLLIAESRIALAAVAEEMDFALRLGQPHAPAEPL